MYIKSKLDPDGDGRMSSSRVVFPIKCPECSITEWPEGITDNVAQEVLEDTVMWVIIIVLVPLSLGAPAHLPVL